MTEPVVAEPPATVTPGASLDYWDIVGAQLRKRLSVTVSAVILLALYAAAIYAPLLANDRPLYFHGVDLGAYRKALRELTVTTTSLEREVREATTVESLTPILHREQRSLDIRLATMRRQLTDDDADLLDRMKSSVDDVVARAEAGDLDGAYAAAVSLSALAEDAQLSLQPVVAGDAPGPGEVVLQPFVAFPVVQNLGQGDVLFMVFWALVLTAPAWNRMVNRFMLRGDRVRIRAARRRKVLLMFLVPAVCAFLWQGRVDAFYVSTYKSGLTTGTVVAKSVVFPPVPYGLAETSDSTFRPPTWHASSVIDAEGYYVAGNRSGRVDTATGLPRQGTRVVVNYGEPDRNSPVRHVLGTDSLGRDLLTRMVWGARVSLAVGLVATILLVAIGTFVGSLAGFYGGWIDTVFSRLIEIVQTFPFFFLVLIVVAFVGPSILNIMLVIGLLRWTGVARLVRGEFIRLRGQDFVVASQALGARNSRTIFRHVLPNALGPVLVAATFSVASGILTESALSFLGFGVQLPIPSWGALLIESRQQEHWWIQVFPGLFIFITVLLYNLLGEGVRDALDPRLKVMR
jgi:peptide/nickel transport system permease protein